MRLMMVGKAILVSALTIGLVSCGGGSGAGAVATATSTAVTGSAGDGPITGGSVTVTDANGTVVTTTPANPTTGANAKFSFTVPSGTPAPLTITVSGGVDTVTGLAQDFPLQTAVAVLPAGGAVTGNANPLSTLAVASAAALPGGLTAANLTTATTNVLGAMGFGLDAATNPITTPISDVNVANVLRANEAVAEMIRRASNASGGTLLNTIAAIGQDLTDGQVDGAVATGAISTQVSNTTAAQVLTQQAVVSSEVLANNLTVTTPAGVAIPSASGANFVATLNSSIVTIGNTADAVNDAPTQAFLDQTRAAVQISNALAGGAIAALNDIIGSLNGMAAGVVPSTAQRSSLANLTANAGASFVVASTGAGNTVTAGSATAAVVAAANDTIAPAAPAITAPVAGVTANNIAQVSGTAEAGSLVTVLSGNVSVGTVTAAAATAAAPGAWTLTTTALTDGINNLSATATDTAGNTGTASTIVALTVDTAGPTVVISSTSPALTNVSPIPVVLTFNEPATGVLVADIAVGNGTAGNFVAVSSTVYTADITPTADGAVTFDVAANAATDAVGNNSSAATQLSVTFDTIAPVAPSITSPLANAVTNIITPNASGTSEANATVRLYDTNGTTLLGTATANGAGAWSLTSTTLADGGHTLTATATDVAGNTGAASTGVLATIDTVRPVIALVGANPVTVNASGAYSDAGATASDNISGNLTVSIVATPNVVNVNAAGSYTVTYNVTDTAGNAAITVSRTVVVTASAAADNQISAGNLNAATTTYTNMLTANPADIEAAIGLSITAMAAVIDNQSVRTLATQLTLDSGATLPTSAAVATQVNSSTPVANPILVSWAQQPSQLVNTAITANQLQDPGLDPVVAELGNAITRLEAVKTAGFVSQQVRTKTWDVADVDALLSMLYSQRALIRWARAYNWDTQTNQANVSDMLPVLDLLGAPLYDPISVDPVAVLNDPSFFTLQAANGVTLLAGSLADSMRAAQLDVAFQTAMLNSLARRADNTHPFLAMTSSKSPFSIFAKPQQCFNQFGLVQCPVQLFQSQAKSDATLNQAILDAQHAIAALDSTGAGLNVSVVWPNGQPVGGSTAGVIAGHKAFVGAAPLSRTLLATFEYVDFNGNVVIPNVALSQQFNKPVVSQSPTPIIGSTFWFLPDGTITYLKLASPRPLNNGQPVNDPTLNGVLSQSIGIDVMNNNTPATGQPVSPMVVTYP